MRPFATFLEDGTVEERLPDPAKARSLMRQARARVRDVEDLPLDETTAAFRFEDAYEAVREAVQAHMAKEGYHVYGHEAIPAYAVEAGLLGRGDAERLDRFRKKRNDINHRGQTAQVEETRRAVEWAGEVVQAIAERLEG